MAQFKRFSGSESQNYNSSYVGAEGELTWDPDNGLRIHDGNTSGGNQIGGGGFSGNYNDLADRPFIPTSLTDLIGADYSNNRQFLRYNVNTGQYEFSSDFRVVPSSDVAYPNGTLGQDKAGDVAFSAGAIYYCVNEPNSYSLTWVDPVGWASGIIELSNRGPNNEVLALGSKLTDGTTVATVTELLTGGWDGTRQVVRIDPEISQWRSGTGTLTALTSGTTANTEVWVKFSVVPPVAVNEGSEIRDYGAEAGSDPSTGDITIENSTYKKHWLLNINGNPVGNRRYVLGNGQEGDVIYFMPGSGFKPEENLLSVSNYEYYDSATGQYTFKSGVVQLFGTTANNMETVVKATWSYSAWHFSGPVTKIS